MNQAQGYKIQTNVQLGFTAIWVLIDRNCAIQELSPHLLARKAFLTVLNVTLVLIVREALIVWLNCHVLLGFTVLVVIQDQRPVIHPWHALRVITVHKDSWKLNSQTEPRSL